MSEQFAAGLITGAMLGLIAGIAFTVLLFLVIAIKSEPRSR